MTRELPTFPVWFNGAERSAELLVRYDGVTRPATEDDLRAVLALLTRPKTPHDWTPADHKAAASNTSGGSVDSAQADAASSNAASVPSAEPLGETCSQCWQPATWRKDGKVYCSPCAEAFVDALPIKNPLIALLKCGHVFVHQRCGRPDGHSEDHATEAELALNEVREKAAWSESERLRQIRLMRPFVLAALSDNTTKVTADDWKALCLAGVGEIDPLNEQIAKLQAELAAAKEQAERMREVLGDLANAARLAELATSESFRTRAFAQIGAKLRELAAATKTTICGACNGTGRPARPAAKAPMQTTGLSDEWLKSKIATARDVDAEAGLPLPLADEPPAKERGEAGEPLSGELRRLADSLSGGNWAGRVAGLRTAIGSAAINAGMLESTIAAQQVELERVKVELASAKAQAEAWEGSAKHLERRIGEIQREHDAVIAARDGFEHRMLSLRDGMRNLLRTNNTHAWIAAVGEAKALMELVELEAKARGS
jgi:predicted  nucleic acid-binding Zn-ribbon protein